VFHSAVFSHCQAFAGSLQVFHADIFLFARFQAFGGGFMGGGHGPVPLDVFLGLFLAVLRVCYRKRSYQRNTGKGWKYFLDQFIHDSP
jgi:hypothetical protein